MARKRPNGEGTIRQRPDGRWEGRYCAGRDPGTGKLIRKSIYGKTEKEVSQRLRKIGMEVDEGTYQEPSKMTVSTWLDIWIEEYNNSNAATTIRTYKAHITNHIKPGLGAMKLQQLTIPDIQRFCNNLQKKEKPLAAKTVNVIHGVLHKALDQALELGYIKSNPATRTKLPKIVKPKIVPLSDNEIKAFMAAIEEHRFRRLFITDLFTGIRESELVGLTWDFVYFNTGEIEIHHQLQKVGDNTYKLVPLKNNKPRIIAPAKLVMDVLEEQLLHQKKQRLKAGSAWNNEMNLVFTNDIGRYITGNMVYKAYKRIVKELDFPESRLHDLRHTFAVNSLRAGDDIKTVQDNLGHHTAAFTLDTYAHVTDQMRKDSSERMQAYIDSLQTK